MSFNFLPFSSKMKSIGAADVQVKAFSRSCSKAFDESGCYVLEKDITPVSGLPRWQDLPALDPQESDDMLKRCAILRLNGGLATSMGMEGGPKSLVPVHGELTFLDIALHQVLYARKRIGGQFLPLILMNSFNTSAQTMEHVAKYVEFLKQPVHPELMQSRVPRIEADSLAPYSCPTDPQSEWCPPGHGDVYLAFFLTGVLSKLLSRGIRYLFLSNIDNLGAVVDSRIPFWMSQNKCPFLMEVSRRCNSDRKGGHLARSIHGNFILREYNMCAPSDKDDFINIDKYNYFNTNNLWFDVEQLHQLITSKSGLLDLPVICNHKTLRVTQTSAVEVYQVETACGSIISSFPNAAALEVPRSRFLPVKNLNDLLVARSDLIKLGSDYIPQVYGKDFVPPVIKLPKEVRDLDDFSHMFPYGVPKIARCRLLDVQSPIVFGKNVTCVGDVTITATQKVSIPNDTILEGTVHLNAEASTLEDQ
ncbi:MAG: UTP--glucose-1-phosphate uridylyltransferase [bacterium]|nr:UTP--glucose-1-phosphate uridylyltransferase [bacterium]